MLQAIRLANRAQVSSQITLGLNQAQATIVELVKYIMREETKNRLSFRQSIRELENDLARLRNTVSGSTRVSDPAYNDFLRQCRALEEKIQTIYQSIQQMRSPTNSDEIDLLRDWTGELEGILIDPTTPQYRALKQVIPHPTPEQIEALSNKQPLSFNNDFQTNGKMSSLFC